MQAAGGGSGTGTNTGGFGSGRGGSAGTDGNPGGETGEGGMAGAGADTEPPTIVSFAPADGDEEVERDIAITATFSEPIDERSVTTTSFVLDGAWGRGARDAERRRQRGFVHPESKAVAARRLCTDGEWDHCRLGWK